MILNGAELQRQTLRLYGELMAQRESWAGQLVFAHGPAASATGLAAAVSIAGGTSLLLDPDTSTVKSVFRQGGVDFVVNTLDEALRVLKNELRKHRPLSVVLEGAEQPVIAEMRERGVLPDLQVSIGEIAVTEAQLAREWLQLRSEPDLVVPSAKLAEWSSGQGWSEVVLQCSTSTDLRKLDAQLLSLVTDETRRTWIQRIGHYQRVMAGGARVVWLTKAESLALKDDVAV